jgi:leucyl aminopeptidase
MLNLIESLFAVEKSKDIIPIILMNSEKWNSLSFNKTKEKWLKSTEFRAKPFDYRLVPNNKGGIQEVVVGVDELNTWCLGDLSKALPKGDYYIKSRLSKEVLWHLSLGWGLGAYRFKDKESVIEPKARLLVPDHISKKRLQAFLETFYWIRDLINLPSSDLTPVQLAENAREMAQIYGARTKVLVGEELLQENYPLVYAVGKGSIHQPSFTSIEWGKKEHPKVSLVGKGITFDTGGVNIKPDSAMRLMKKDMGGAAHALGLGRLIMEMNLPIHLQILIPSAENAVSGNAYKPLDVIKSRKGLTIEISHTDAEGRLVLADALCESASHQPELLIDFATLTGAIRVALGPELPGIFTNNDVLGSHLVQLGIKMHDPLWQMPLFNPYKKWIKGRNADLCNVASSSLSSEIPHAGAITAALFLQEFIPDETDWVHIDFSAWNYGSKPGRPEGGEVMTLRTLFAYLEKRYNGS